MLDLVRWKVAMVGMRNDGIAVIPIIIFAR